MATPASDQTFDRSGPPIPAMTYATLPKQQKDPVKTVPIKPITYLHSEPQVIWDKDEVKQMIINEDLEYAMIGKFSYGWPDIHELRKLIPNQCALKWECKIELLCNRHILIRESLMEGYVHLLLSKSAFYIT